MAMFNTIRSTGVGECSSGAIDDDVRMRKWGECEEKMGRFRAEHYQGNRKFRQTMKLHGKMIDDRAEHEIDTAVGWEPAGLMSGKDIDASDQRSRELSGKSPDGSICSDVLSIDESGETGIFVVDEAFGIRPGKQEEKSQDTEYQCVEISERFGGAKHYHVEE